MKRMTLAILGATLLTLLSVTSHAAACKVELPFALMLALTKPIADCADPKFPGMRTIEVIKDISVGTTINLPDNTRLAGVNDPYSPKVALKGEIDSQLGYLIKMGNSSQLANLNITNTPAADATPPFAIVAVAGNNNTIALNRIAGSASIGIMVGFSNIYPTFNAIVSNEIAADKGLGIFLNGFKNIVMGNKINREPGNTIVGKVGILITEWPQITVSQNILGGAPDGNALQFAKPSVGELMPIGMAANIMMVNYFPEQFVTGSSTPLTPTNFKEIFGKEPKDMPSCPKDANNQPYTLDGACKQVVATKSCPPSQLLLPSGECGCVAGTSLDPQLNVCIKVVETVIEKIIEKPVTEEASPLPATPPPLDPVVANVQGDSSCSLVPDQQAVSALVPVGMLMLTLGVAGIAAYRFRLETRRIRRKTKE